MIASIREPNIDTVPILDVVQDLELKNNTDNLGSETNSTIAVQNDGTMEERLSEVQELDTELVLTVKIEILRAEPVAKALEPFQEFATKLEPIVEIQTNDDSFVVKCPPNWPTQDEKDRIAAALPPRFKAADRKQLEKSFKDIG